MVETTLREKISRLGYSQLWLDSGVLTNDIIEDQIKEFYLGEDDNTEHYRYRTLTKHFSSHNSFDDVAIRQILELL